MASRNFHKNRTKERKARQRAARARAAGIRGAKRALGFTPCYQPPYFAMGQELSSAAALMMMDRVLPRLFGEKPR